MRLVGSGSAHPHKPLVCPAIPAAPRAWPPSIATGRAVRRDRIWPFFPRRLCRRAPQRPSFGRRRTPQSRKPQRPRALSGGRNLCPLRCCNWHRSRISSGVATAHLGKPVASLRWRQRRRPLAKLRSWKSRRRWLSQRRRRLWSFATTRQARVPRRQRHLRVGFGQRPNRWPSRQALRSHQARRSARLPPKRRKSRWAWTIGHR
mmetsp:Transcript_115124/g.257119  ORF Transcript_115124/g.257119 Transcript_115124/m.257119 type:complete len:204 (+) Transcript_115124:2447-3058(+)